MAMKKSSSPDLSRYAHVFYAVVFGVLAVASLGALLLYQSLTDTSTQSATVGNAVPTVTVYTNSTSDTSAYTGDSGGAASTGIALTENTTTNIYIHGTASDDNGCEQITKDNGTWSAKVYRTNIATAGGSTTCQTADDNDCYNVTETVLGATANSTCTTGGSDLTVNYEFTVPLNYFADATDASSTNAATTWTSQVDLTDSASGSVSGSDVFEIASTAALDVGATVSFGSLSLGATSGSDATMTVTNTGNTLMDLAISSTAFTCTIGSIAVGNSKYSLTSSTAYGSMTALSATPTALTSFDLAARTGAASTKDIYLKMSIPSTGVSGTCNSTITVTAQAG